MYREGDPLAADVDELRDRLATDVDELRGRIKVLEIRVRMLKNRPSLPTKGSTLELCLAIVFGAIITWCAVVVYGKGLFLPW
jgi:hypothetical protein